MFGMGFVEIVIILVIAILFLGPDKLPGAMVDIAKFFRQMKKTVGTMKDSLDEEMNVSEIKQEALAYKKQLLDAQDDIKKIVDIPDVGAQLTNLTDDIIGDIEETTEIKEEKVTFKKKKKKKQEEDDSINV